uniref:Centrosomal protein 112 n=1 Tax=Gadus morhua TaxID=8049 RepID=A0A8C5AN72_GADMO
SISAEGTMSLHDDTPERLDADFDRYLSDMKPYVLKHPNRTERQRCAMWIRKLCDPTMCGSGPVGLKNRNMYARLLLHMLRRGVLDAPFTVKPDQGCLKTLPTYMAIYFDEPLGASGPAVQEVAPLPDWVAGELGHHGSDRTRRSSSPTSATHSRYLSQCIPQTESNVWCVRRSGTLFSCRGFQAIPAPCKGELFYMLEAKHQEEQLRMQQRHDSDVQKILDRKNGEIEELKTSYRAKQKGSEEMIHKLEKKVESGLRESQVIRESKEKQIAELKKMSDQSSSSLHNEWEKKLHAAAADLEQEKFVLQKKHTQSIQELLDDTTQRLTKMEAQYRAQAQSTERTVRELEVTVKQQSAEVEKGKALRQKVTQEKGQLEIQVATLGAELQEASRRSMAQLKEKEEQSEQYEQASERLRATHQADMSHYQQEHALSAAKASEVMEEMERVASQLRQQLQEAEHRRQKQLRVRWEAEGQLERAREDHRQQVRQAEASLEQFRQQVELSSEKTYADMKLQMAEQRVQREQERTRLQQQHSAERDSQARERQREVGSLERQARAALQQHQLHTQEWRERDAQTISELEEQVGCLRQEVAAAHGQRKQQLAEVATLREEERRRDAQDHEASLAGLQAEDQRLRGIAQKAHRQEVEAVREKASSRLRQMEKDHAQKLAKSIQLIAQLQTSVCDCKEEAVRVQQSLERQLEEGQARWDQERRTLSHHADKAHKVLFSPSLAQVPPIAVCVSLFPPPPPPHPHQVTAVRQDCEVRIKGLLPAELQRELEDTITSLKAQVCVCVCVCVCVGAEEEEDPQIPVATLHSVLF